MRHRLPTCLAGDGRLGAFNQQKNHLCLGLNPEAAIPYRTEPKAAGLDGGKSRIRFRKPGDLPLSLAAKCIRDAGKLADRV